MTPAQAGSKHSGKVALPLLLLLLTAGCATVAPDEPEPVTATSTAQAAWEQLIARRDASPAATALVRLHIPGTPSLRARVSRDASGSVEIDVLSPLGTEAIAIYARPNGDTTVMDEIHQSYWRGSFGDVASILHLPDSTAQQFFWLAIGLPAPGEWQPLEGATPVEARYRMRSMVGVAGPSGLVEVQLLAAGKGGSATRIVSYEGSGFPPKAVVFSENPGGSEILRLDVLDFTDGAKVGEPVITGDWERVEELSQLFG